MEAIVNSIWSKEDPPLESNKLSRKPSFEKRLCEEQRIFPDFGNSIDFVEIEAELVDPNQSEITLMTSVSDQKLDDALTYFRQHRDAAQVMRLTEDILLEWHDYPTTNLLWIVRPFPAILDSMIHHGGWFRLNLDQKIRFLKNVWSSGDSRLGYPTSSDARAYGPHEAAALVAEALYHAVLEQLKAVGVTSASPVGHSRYEWRYNRLRRAGGLMTHQTIDLICAADAILLSQNRGMIIVGPSAAVVGELGSLVLGPVEKGDVDYRGLRIMAADGSDSVYQTAVDGTGDLRVDGSMVATEAAAANTIDGVWCTEANADLSWNANGAFITFEAAESEELLVGYGIGIEQFAHLVGRRYARRRQGAVQTGQ